MAYITFKKISLYSISDEFPVDTGRFIDRKQTL